MVAAIFAAILGVSCGPPSQRSETQVADTTRSSTIEAANAALTRALIDLPGVSGVGIGACDGNPCLKVYVVRGDTEAVAEIAETFEGYPVVVEVVGEMVGGSGGA